MKYTRYNYKKSEKPRFTALFIFIVIVFMSLIIGCIISNLFIKDKISGDDGIGQYEEGQEGSDKTHEGTSKGEDKTPYNLKLYSVQCGFFKEDSNAEQCLNKLSSKYPVYIYKDDDGSRVMAGIYDGDKSQEVIKRLKDDGIDSARIGIDFESGSECVKEIGYIADANMKLVNQLEEEGVKSVATKDIKTWINSLEDSKDDKNNEELLEEIKEYTLSLPEEIVSQDISKYYSELFKIMKKLIL